MSKEEPGRSVIIVGTAASGGVVILIVFHINIINITSRNRKFLYVLIKCTFFQRNKVLKPH